MNKHINTLLHLKDIQHRVCVLLISMGYVDMQESEKDELKYSTLKLNKKSKELLNSGISVSDSFIEEFQEYFEKGNRNTKKVIKEYAVKFFLENPQYTEEDVLDAAERWCREKGDFAGQAKYFFYKTDNNKVINSRALEYLELIKKEDDVYKNQMI